MPRLNDFGQLDPAAKQELKEILEALFDEASLSRLLATKSINKDVKNFTPLSGTVFHYRKIGSSKTLTWWGGGASLSLQ